MATTKRARHLHILAIFPLLMAGCDQSTTELIGEIDAAREGCTEEMLKSSDEECVQMFERYAEMGEDALETYIGGMKALDEALRRRGGIQFDTVGLGRVFSDPTTIGSGDSASTVLEPSADPYTSASPSWQIDPGPTWSRDSRRPVAGPRPSEPAADPWNAPGPGAAGHPYDERPDPSLGSASPRRQPTPAPRGTILPPEERLRRPWIDDSEPADGYYERRDPVNERRGDEFREPFEDEPAPARYPRE